MHRHFLQRLSITPTNRRVAIVQSSVSLRDRDIQRNFNAETCLHFDLGSYMKFSPLDLTLAVSLEADLENAFLCFATHTLKKDFPDKINSSKY